MISECIDAIQELKKKAQEHKKTEEFQQDLEVSCNDRNIIEIKRYDQMMYF